MDMNMQAVAWMVLLVLFLAAEAITLGLTTIWFAGGALVAFILAMLGVNLFLQIAVFCVVSVLLLVVTRPMATKWLNRGRVKTNAESLIGDTGIVTEEIDNLANQGQVQVHGQFWTARVNTEEGKIAKGTRVKIEKISGVKLIVKEEK